MFNMSLTYSQKQLIQKHYPAKSSEELAKELGIPVHKVEKHIQKNTKFFENKETGESGNETVELFSFSGINSWIKANWINIAILFLFIIVAYINAIGAEFVSD